MRTDTREQIRATSRVTTRKSDCTAPPDNVVPINVTTDAPRQWTIKGISPETVEVSREAARRSGMKINSWVGQALQRAAEGAERVDSQAIDELLAKKIEELEEHLKERLEYYLQKEFDRLRAENAHIESTVNTISSIVLKLSMKSDLIK